MKFFIDSADVSAIRGLARTGLVDGVTTNPSLIAKSGRNIHEVIAEICEIADGPVSAEVTAIDRDGMLFEGRQLAEISPKIAVKVPLTIDGLDACKILSGEGKMVNVTLCFSAGQALLAAKMGATFISPFVGRLDDIGENGMGLIADIVQIYKNYGYATEVLVASVRGQQHVIEAAKIGAHIVTVPPSVIDEMYKHDLTDKGLAAFLADWKKSGQSISGGGGGAA